MGENPLWLVITGVPSLQLAGKCLVFEDAVSYGSLGSKQAIKVIYLKYIF